MKNILLFVATIIVVFGCSESNINPAAVNIRLVNKSDFNFQNIVVNTSTGNVDFGDLKSGKSSDYKVFDTAYRYAYVKLEIKGNTLTIQPFDYVGETPLKNGKYSYELYTDNPNEEFGSLAIELVEE
ncbi:hypothetical protein [Marivirga harenae]|uniref:hypothetical protein n=1 Tax=Marivirga harenae TaxID=2010992 RepID=UPI0026E0D259|nr:hypothetical protein [Marivirga harenae]WKV12455.1 hypothetical protein Q3Y49_01220 [Marivirga harenae]|tara:strand:+ start:79050 stop:79430 length:381 start_codon:yes stop_codon:yes gene_type:complete